ncbi:hypothetical protein DVT68_04740 [Dyella solisilvae]|uniref:Uncharacterized protein n=1 Tax=Dyella solisilvae TaxID=1920168 RepID=A0A370KDG8_9GAMM|nr:hypothetical protein [Dyella solisilvae]RDJ00669.1 hypothetical protein DVT68_04740 [Dyella solisilvae]
MDLAPLLSEARQRLHDHSLLGGEGSVSLRLPGQAAMVWLPAGGGEPQSMSLQDAQGDAVLHAAVYLGRDDIGAVLLGGGAFTRLLGGFGGQLPQVFDEQARHLGRTASPLASSQGNLVAEARRCLASGGNLWICRQRALVLGTTAQRLVLNAELAEKCAKAYVLAAGTGAKVDRLPWWVCHIANGRLRKDQRRAAERFAAGELPEESTGY